MFKNIFKRNDLILIVAILLFSICCIVVFKYFVNTEGSYVKVTLDGKEYGIYSLNKDEIVDIDGRNTLVIEDGIVYMKEADCADKLCIKQGRISLNHESIVCLPNKIVVEIINDNQSSYDAVTR